MHASNKALKCGTAAVIVLDYDVLILLIARTRTENPIVPGEGAAARTWLHGAGKFNEMTAEDGEEQA